MEYSPLVSVVVVTYNSSAFIIEALDSVKEQTYKNIELIVSDDCSTDDTLIKVRQWLNRNAKCFVDTKLITAESNTGVTCNVNRGCSSCKGEWIKSFAGDDILFPTCIEDNITFVKNKNGIHLVISNSVIFFQVNKKELIQKPGLLVPDFFELEAVDQYEALVRNEVLLNSNSLFLSSVLFRDIKFDERMKFLEDRPFFWNCTKNGYRISYLDKETVRYRKYSGALTGLSGKRLVSLYYHDSMALFYYLVRKPEMEKRSLDTSCYEKQILWYLIIKYILKNKGNLLTKLLVKFFSRTIY